MLTVACPSCGHRLGIPEQFSGEVFRCKQCGNSFKVSPPPPPTSPAPDLFTLNTVDQPAGAASAGPKPLVPVAPRPDPNMIRFSCPKCKAGFESPPSQAGTKFHCSACGQRIQVPELPPNKTVLGSLDPPPGAAPPSYPPPVPYPPPGPVPRADNVPVAQYDNSPRLPSISINVNTAQPAAPQPPPPRRRRRYRRYEEDEGYYEPEPPSGGAGTALGITSMVLGIVALPFAIIPCLVLFALPLGGLGLLLGLLGLLLGNNERGGSPGFAIAGVSCSGVALVLALVWMLAVPNFWTHRWWWR
jgi:DNA-directed RNA polymerase subunit RPC12/RpoP